MNNLIKALASDTHDTYIYLLLNVCRCTDYFFKFWIPFKYRWILYITEVILHVEVIVQKCCIQRLLILFMTTGYVTYDPRRFAAVIYNDVKCDMLHIWVFFKRDYTTCSYLRPLYSQQGLSGPTWSPFSYVNSELI